LQQRIKKRKWDKRMGNRCKRACVTGGAGFIGSHVVQALLRRGIEVTVLDNLSVGLRSKVSVDARLVVGDILNPEKVSEALIGCDAVLHLAARVAIRSSFEFAVDDTTTNCVGTASVLRCAQKSNSVRKFISTSSMAVYADGPGPAPIDEEYQTRPTSPYGISKLASEGLTHTMCSAAGIQSAVLRLFNTYGPGQALSPYVGVVTIFVNKLVEDDTPVIFGDGQQCRDFVHVEDVAQAFVTTLEADLSGETLNIGSGRPTTINAVFHSVKSALGKSINADYLPAVPGELKFSVADIKKARRLLGYQPTHHFDKSIAAVVEEICSATNAARPPAISKCAP
jgi:UDP-glucose 4-epimerase